MDKREVFAGWKEDFKSVRGKVYVAYYLLTGVYVVLVMHGYYVPCFFLAIVQTVLSYLLAHTKFTLSTEQTPPNILRITYKIWFYSWLFGVVAMATILYLR